MSDAIADYWTKRPPIEGRPNIQTSDEYWQNEYSKQRQGRMQDAIDDYLQDDRVSARQAYEEILSCVDDVINYHKKEYDKAVELKSLMLGHRECDLLECADSLATAE
jgi:hypothetical protein